jgi:hypothetical protein
MRRGGVITVYAVLATAAISAWVFAGATGFAFGSTSSHDKVPASLRSSPGGYRAFHFWHSGYQGGK